MSNWHTTRRRCLRYVGSKTRIVPRIAAHLKATRRDCLVDVFGGSGAVVMNAGFHKRIYNDIDGELVNFFRVLADPTARRWLLQTLKRLPMSRQLFTEMQLSRKTSPDPIHRAAAYFYASSFAFGGKIRYGGFAASTAEAVNIKEISRYRNVLRELAAVGNFWQDTVIEQQPFTECIRLYGNRAHVVLYCDPPYVGTERYYQGQFTPADHLHLSAVLAEVAAPAVVSYYPFPGIDDLYPAAAGWRKIEIEGTRNSTGRSLTKQRSTELLLCRGTEVTDDLPLFQVA